MRRNRIHSTCKNKGHDLNDNLYALFRSRFPTDGGAPFLETEAGRIVTYDELDAETAAYANALIVLGAEPGDRIAAEVEKSPQAVFLYLACLRAGLIFLPLNPAYTDEEIAYFIADAAPRLFVCAPGREETIIGLGGATPFMVMSMGVAGESGSRPIPSSSSSLRTT